MEGIERAKKNVSAQEQWETMAKTMENNGKKQ